MNKLDEDTFIIFSKFEEYTIHFSESEEVGMQITVVFKNESKTLSPEVTREVLGNVRRSFETCIEFIDRTIGLSKNNLDFNN